MSALLGDYIFTKQMMNNITIPIMQITLPLTLLPFPLVVSFLRSLALAIK